MAIFFHTFAVTTGVVNREMIVRFQRVIFRMKKVLINKVQIKQTATDYSRFLFVQIGSNVLTS